MAAKTARPMFAVKLDFADYINFAQWITENDRYRTTPPGQLGPQIETKLQQLNAQVYESCTGPSRPFIANSDKVHPHPDQGKHLNVALPVEICRDSNGDLDLGYLIGYVQAIKAASDQDGARALLGMYFLSRCR